MLFVGFSPWILEQHAEYSGYPVRLVKPARGRVNRMGEAGAAAGRLEKGEAEERALGNPGGGLVERGMGTEWHQSHPEHFNTADPSNVIPPLQKAQKRKERDFLSSDVLPTHCSATYLPTLSQDARSLPLRPRC